MSTSMAIGSPYWEEDDMCYRYANSPSVYRGGARRAGAFQTKCGGKNLEVSAPRYAWNSLRFTLLRSSLYKQRDSWLCASLFIVLFLFTVEDYGNRMFSNKVMQRQKESVKPCTVARFTPWGSWNCPVCRSKQTSEKPHAYLYITPTMCPKLPLV